MRFFFLIARIYPYWALPVALVFGELGIYLRRRNNLFQYTCFMTVMLLIIGIGAWFYYRGDVHSDDWVRILLGDSR